MKRMVLSICRCQTPAPKGSENVVPYAGFGFVALPISTRSPGIRRPGLLPGMSNVVAVVRLLFVLDRFIGVPGGGTGAGVVVGAKVVVVPGAGVVVGPRVVVVGRGVVVVVGAGVVVVGVVVADGRTVNVPGVQVTPAAPTIV